MLYFHMNLIHGVKRKTIQSLDQKDVLKFVQEEMIGRWRSALFTAFGGSSSDLSYGLIVFLMIQEVSFSIYLHAINTISFCSK